MDELQDLTNLNALTDELVGYIGILSHDTMTDTNSYGVLSGFGKESWPNHERALN